ncbi:MAG: glycosyltransferase [Candidatus Hydrogenedentes bacterium]|nr:glycosyltransferase [Candidatus Hydrogenedentota bacterium]
MFKISVIIPTHNRIAVLLCALRNLQEGSVLPDEVIVVDDGSEIAAELELGSHGFPFELRFIRFETGRGAPSARNAGIRAATGDLLILIDDDIFLDHHSIRFHKLIHERHPQSNYGVMGRVYFDPELTRTPLMHFLEEYDCFQGIAKAPDKSLASFGLISANFSMKQEFLKDKDLFDENFPFNRNEDTEFGLRMIKHGLELRFHIAPSARHHSPLDLDTHFRQVWKGGFSKAYWVLKSPDDTKNCLLLGSILNRKRHEVAFTSVFERYVDTLGVDFLEQDIVFCSPAEFEAFGRFVKTATGWLQAIGSADGWTEMVSGFSEVSDHALRAFDCSDIDNRIRHLQEACRCAEDFLPITLLLADELIAAKRLEEAETLLHPFEHVVWAKLRLASLTCRLGRHHECERLLREIFDVTGFGRAVDWEQRNLMAPTLNELRKKHRVGDRWVESITGNLSGADMIYSQQWVDAVSEESASLESSASFTRMQSLAVCEAKIREIEREAHYGAGQPSRARRVYDFMEKGRSGSAKGLLRNFAKLAKVFGEERSPVRTGPRYR